MTTSGPLASRQWLTDYQQVQLPRWDQLPMFPLHLDQLVDLANTYLTPLPIESLTPAMVSNYVKAHVMVPPEKKHYGRIHLAAVMLLGLFKMIYPLDTIRQAFAIELATGSPQTLYDQFVARFNTEIQTFGQTDASGNRALSPTFGRAIIDVGVTGILNSLAGQELVALGIKEITHDDAE